MAPLFYPGDEKVTTNPAELVGGDHGPLRTGLLSAGRRRAGGQVTPVPWTDTAAKVGASSLSRPVPWQPSWPTAEATGRQRPAASPLSPAGADGRLPRPPPRPGRRPGAAGGLPGHAGCRVLAGVAAAGRLDGPRDTV